MPLTPDDVVLKEFQHVRFQEGLDPDEVDEFLDQIVVEWRKTIAENQELKARLAQYEEGGAPAGQAALTAGAGASMAPVGVAVLSGSQAGSTGESAGIIELAQRVHDEHVAEGVLQRDRLIAEANAKAVQIVTEAESRGREEIARLERERITLESRISELRQFESDYRAQLRGFIETKLRDLDTGAPNVGAPPAVGQ